LSSEPEKTNRSEKRSFFPKKTSTNPSFFSDKRLILSLVGAYGFNTDKAPQYVDWPFCRSKRLSIDLKENG
jgi:hypothetical protein